MKFLNLGVKKKIIFYLMNGCYLYFNYDLKLKKNYKINLFLLKIDEKVKQKF